MPRLLLLGDRSLSHGLIFPVRRLLPSVFFALLLLLALSHADSAHSSSDPESVASLPRLRHAHAAPFPWLDPSLPLSSRVASLILALSLPEKVTLMQDNTPAIPRLSVPAYSYYSQAEHGVANVDGVATMFPNPLAQAASFDRPGLRAMARVLGREARAYYNAYAATHHNDSAQYFALSELLPAANLFTHAHWGRGQESYGECPSLASLVIGPIIEGLQTTQQGVMLASATCKHFFAYALDGDTPLGGHDPEVRTHFYENLTRADILQTYAAPFEACARAKVEGMMVGYQSLNGHPVTVHPLLATLTAAWNWTGYLVADGSRLLQCLTNYHYTDNLTALAAVGVNAKLDMEIDRVYQDHLVDAIAAGWTTGAKVDEALTRSLSTRFRLGLFDPPGSVPYSSLNSSILDAPSSRELSYRLAVESAVLLKNDGALPIDAMNPAVTRIAVVGPNANRTAVLLSNYEGCQLSTGGVNAACTLITPLMGLVGRLQAVNERRAEAQLAAITWTFDEGVDANSNDTARMAAALAHVEAADVCIAVMGLDISLEAEAHDRPNLDWPGQQGPLLRRLQAGTTPVVLVMLNAGPLLIAEQALSPTVGAIVEAWYGGEEAGHAIADLLLGSRAFSGRLPITFPLDATQVPYYFNLSMRAAPGRTYRYSTVVPLYAFGYGLSYTAFEYSAAADGLIHPARLSPCKGAACDGVEVEVRFRVRNAGSRVGSEVAAAYVSYQPFAGTAVGAAQSLPRTELKEFELLLDVDAGQSRDVTLRLPATGLRLVGSDGAFALLPGVYLVHVGGSAPGSRGAFVDGEEQHGRTATVAASTPCTERMYPSFSVKRGRERTLTSPHGIADGLLGAFAVC